MAKAVAWDVARIKQPGSRIDYHVEGGTRYLVHTSPDGTQGRHFALDDVSDSTVRHGDIVVEGTPYDPIMEAILPGESSPELLEADCVACRGIQ